MLALLDDLGAVERCPMLDVSEYFSEESDIYPAYNSPASSCIDDPNVAAEVEIAKDLADNEEFSFYEQCLTNLGADLQSSVPWASLADVGDTITDFSLNECRSRQTEGESSQSGSVCSDDYWNRCNSWVNSTRADVGSDGTEYKHKSQSKTKRKCNKMREDSVEKLSWKDMTSSQQRATIEHLTQVVSSHMGLREQLDVIRIVNPKAVVSATDTEFEIDLELLNCEKLDRIREYVKQHGAQEVKSSKNYNQGSVRKSKRKDLNQHKNKAKADKEQNALLSRVYKQLLKEKRSGLFRNEQVISISKTKLRQEASQGNSGDDDGDGDDDMEIDILH